jgi:hypothetical protein
MATITRIYDTYAHAQSVFDELRRIGFTEGELSLVASKSTSDEHANVRHGDWSGRWSDGRRRIVGRTWRDGHSRDWGGRGRRMAGGNPAHRASASL